MAEWLKNKIDEELFKELQQLPGLLFHRAIKQDADSVKNSRQAFLADGTLPKFTYTRADETDVDGYLLKLNEFEKRLKHDNQAVLKLYRDKISELRTRAELVLAIKNKDGQKVTELSTELFGGNLNSADEFRAEFKEMLGHASSFHSHKRPIDAELFTKMVQKTLDHYGMDDWHIKLTNKPSILIKRGFAKHGPVINIPKSMQVSKARAARLLVHEIEVHALRTQNGSKSKLALLQRGLDKYIPIDEGLATYYQTLLATKEHKHAPGFWDAWTAALTKVGSFKETFDTISMARTELATKMGNDNPEEIGEDAAWRLCLRAYRGITDLSEPGVGFLRDHIYRTGHDQIKHAIEEHGKEILPMLFSGNVGLHHLEILKELGIEPGRLPELVGKDVVKKILKNK